MLTSFKKFKAALLLTAALGVALPAPAVVAQDQKAARAAGTPVDNDSPRRAVGQRPAPKSLEGSIWIESDKTEVNAKTSGERVRDSSLETYVQSVMDRVIGPYKGEARVYVMERPFFNASMAPNGYTEVWTGLLLRVQTEDELAFVLGHEAGHYLHSHSVTAYQSFKDGQNAALAASIIITVVAAGAMSNASSYNQIQNISNTAQTLINIVYLGSIAAFFGYSRELEGYADIYGFALATDAGYDASAGARLWRDRLDETAASDYERVRKSPTRINVFGSHPLENERVESLRSYDRNVHQGKESTPELERQLAARKAYRDQIRPYLGAWLKDDLRREDYGQTIHIINRLLVDNQDAGLLLFYRAEALRLRGTDADLKAAEVDYLEALKAPDAPLGTHRQLGEVYRKQGKTDLAVAAFEAYLKAAPDAEDAWIVEDMITTLKTPETTDATTETSTGEKPNA